MLLFNRYEYNPQTDLIGKGRFSRVYKALDKKFNRWLALKIYKTGELSAKYSPIADIQQVIALDHPNICRYLDIEEIEKEDAFGEKEKIQVYVMELLDAGNLAQYYIANKDLTILKKLLSDVLNGLSYLHKNGIIHRDIKPANILIKDTVEGPIARITDFGIDKRSGSADNSSASALITSVPYMAPEQFNAKKYGVDEEVSNNIDFWSLGVAVYEIISGAVLFKTGKDDSREQVMNNIMSPEIPEKINQLPQPFRDFVSNCVIKDAKVGVQKAEGLLAILRDTTSSDVAISNIPVGDAAISDITILIPPMPSAAPDDTQILPKASEDDTRVLIQHPPATDETLTPAKHSDADDNTQLLIHIPAAADDTRVLIQKPPVPDATEQPLPKSDASDDTQLFVREKKQDITPVPRTIKEESLSLFNRYVYNPATDLIGKGGFSRVYRAFDKKLNRWVALKIYKTGEFSDRYSPIAEIQRVINFDHSNICRYLDIEEMEKENTFGEREKTQICVMELLDGGNIAQHYASNKTDEVLKKLINDVLNGLSYLHKNGIIHRDIKPANILIKETMDGPVAKITDFGISKKSDSVNNNSSSALIVSIPYMAPEQLNVKKYGLGEKISFNLDLWSLGVTIYEVITGKVLFKNSEQDSSEQIMTNIMAPELPEKIKELPQPFRDIVMHCIIKDARDRAQKAEELIVLLHRNYPGETIPPVTTQPAQSAGKTLEVITSARPEESQRTSFFIDSPAADELEKKSKAKRLISVVNGEESQPMTKHEKMVTYLRVAVGIAAVLLVVTLYFYFKDRRRDDAAVISNKKPPDPVTTVSSPPVNSPLRENPSPQGGVSRQDGSKTNNAQTNTTAPSQSAIPVTVPDTAKPPASAGATLSSGPLSATAGKRSRRSHERNNTEYPENTVEKSSNAQKYILKLSANKSCTVKINNSDYGLLSIGQIIKLYLKPGKYLIQAISTDNSASVYTGLLDVTEANLGAVAPYSIPLP